MLGIDFDQTVTIPIPCSWLPEIHGYQKFMATRNSWLPEIHGYQKFMATRNSWLSEFNVIFYVNTASF
jgi:hypothetical protein